MWGKYKKKKVKIEVYEDDYIEIKRIQRGLAEKSMLKTITRILGMIGVKNYK